MKLAWVLLLPSLVALTTACSEAYDGPGVPPPTPRPDSGLDEAAADPGDASVAEPLAGPGLETTIPPTSVPTPARPVTFKTKRNVGSALATDVTCNASDEGLGDCADAEVVWCSAGKMVALDCALFTADDRTRGFCGEVPDADGQIGCLLTKGGAP